MNKITRFSFIAIVISALLSAVNANGLGGINAPSTNRPVQYDDPYSEFRNARYSNAGVLNERDEIKLGTQLHREVTKKYNLTDCGIDARRPARSAMRAVELETDSYLQVFT
jgi:hypothetical protein